MKANVASYPRAFFKLSMALIATTPVRLGKRVWRPWIGDDDRCDNDEREATKRVKTNLDELTGYGSSYDSLFFNRGDCQGAQVLIVSQRKLHNCPPAGHTSLARLTVDENMQYSLQVLLHTIESGEVESVDHFMKLCDKISDYSTYKFCPGFDYDLYMEKYHSKIRYHPSQIQITTSPFKRVQSSHCTMWHKLPKNATKAQKSSLSVLCSTCKRLRGQLDRALQRCTSYSPRRKIKRQQPSSNYPLKYMSPASLKKRKSNTQQERNKDKKALAKYRHMEVTLDDDQNDEMVEIMDKIDTIGEKTLEEIFMEAESSGIGSSVRGIWEDDKRNMKDLKTDQKRNSKCFYYEIIMILYNRNTQ